MSELDAMFAAVKVALADAKPVVVGLWLNPKTLAVMPPSVGQGRSGIPVQTESYLPPNLALVEYSDGAFELVQLQVGGWQ